MDIVTEQVEVKKHVDVRRLSSRRWTGHLKNYRNRKLFEIRKEIRWYGGSGYSPKPVVVFAVSLLDPLRSPIASLMNWPFEIRIRLMSACLRNIIEDDDLHGRKYKVDIII